VLIQPPILSPPFFGRFSIERAAELLKTTQARLLRLYTQKNKNLLPPKIWGEKNNYCFRTL
jgi:hypothetical protein